MHHFRKIVAILVAATLMAGAASASQVQFYQGMFDVTAEEAFVKIDLHGDELVVAVDEEQGSIPGAVKFQDEDAEEAPLPLEEDFDIEQLEGFGYHQEGLARYADLDYSVSPVEVEINVDADIDAVRDAVLERFKTLGFQVGANDMGDLTHIERFPVQHGEDYWRAWFYDLGDDHTRIRVRAH